MAESDFRPDSGFDLRSSTAKTDDAISRLPTAQAASQGAKQSNLDSQINVQLHTRLMSYYLRELRRQEDNRHFMAIDEDFYDNEQWSDDDKATLKERGQIPIVYNVLKPTCDWIIGTEKRSRTDFKVLPRRKDSSKAAERKTQLMKYLNDVNRSQFGKSRAFEDCVKVGVGWLECGVQDDDDGEPVYDRWESWRNILWDSASVEQDMSDCRYMARQKWVDLDVAKSMFPKRGGTLETAAIESDRFLLDASHGDDPMDTIEVADGIFRTDRQEFAFNRPRVRLIEVWYRATVDVRKIYGGEFSGDILDEDHPGHAEQIKDHSGNIYDERHPDFPDRQEAGKPIIITRERLRMHVAVMCIKGLLFASQSPYRHNLFPFTPIWCYRRGRNALPYGVIRGLRDNQQDVNKRASKALHILSTSKTIMDEGAVPDLDAFKDEVSRPDAIIVKKAGKELTINADRDLAPAHLGMMQRSIEMIQSASGVTDENMGRKTNATSGIAIQARQNQGSLSTAGIFDNLRFANQVHGEKSLSLIEQYFTEQKSFRITNMRGTPEYVTVNDGLPENDIIRSKADFIISEDDWRMSVRQAQVSELLGLLQQIAPVAPQIAMVTLDLIVEAMDVPNRDELVRRIRQQTGMRDPDAEGPTPQEIAKAKEAAEQAAMQKAMVQAEIAEKQAGAALKGAQAGKMQADTQINAQKAIAAIAGQNVETQKAALEAALVLLASPPASGVADGVLHEAGFKGRSEQEEDAQRQAVVDQQQQAAQAQADQQQQAQAQAAQQQQDQQTAQQQGVEQPQDGAPPQ